MAVWRISSHLPSRHIDAASTHHPSPACGADGRSAGATTADHRCGVARGSGDGSRSSSALWPPCAAAVVAAHAARFPGTRPWGWWEWTAPEPRKLLHGAHGCPARDRVIAERQGRLYYGAPGVYCCPQCWQEVYESQTRYLRRVALLLPEETALVPVGLPGCDVWYAQRYPDLTPALSLEACQALWRQLTGPATA
jgi:hypothetical protein